MKASVKSWEDTLQAPPLSCCYMIRDGYQIPFTSTPPPSFEKNNGSALRNSDFVESSIQELLADGRIREVNEVPYTVNPLLVSEGEKPRLVLDFKKYQSLRSVHKITIRRLKDPGGIIRTGRPLGDLQFEIPP